MHSQKIGEKGNTKSILLLFLVFSMVLVPALRSPIPTPVVMVLSGEKRVTYTSNKIDAMLPRAIEVREGHLLTPWILMRARGAVIYVGHGTPRGIQIGSKLVGWTDFAEQVQRTPSRMVYVASCYSQKAEQVVEATSTKQVFGFKGLVDVDEAAYSIAASIMYARGKEEAARNFLHTLTKVMFGKVLTPEKYHLWTLMIDGGGGGSGSGSGSGDLSRIETGYWLGQIVIGFLAILFNAALPGGASQAVKIGVRLIGYGIMQTLWNVVFFAKGWLALWPLVRSILSILEPLADAIRKVLTWWQMVIVGSEIIAGIATYIASGGTYVYAKIAVATATIVAIGLGIYGDWQDSDDTVG